MVWLKFFFHFSKFPSLAWSGPKTVWTYEPGCGFFAVVMGNLACQHITGFWDFSLRLKETLVRFLSILSLRLLRQPHECRQTAQCRNSRPGLDVWQLVHGAMRKRPDTLRSTYTQILCKEEEKNHQRVKKMEKKERKARRCCWGYWWMSWCRRKARSRRL